MHDDKALKQKALGEFKALPTKLGKFITRPSDRSC